MKTNSERSAVLVISMGFLVLYLLLSWSWAVYVSVTVGLLGALSSYLSEKIELAWMGLSRVLGYIIPSIILGLVFYLVLFPIATVSRFFTKDPLMLSPKYKTYFIDINKDIAKDKDSLEKIW